jgi:glutamate-1-semialdehyde 2,1-aminomutase
MSVIQKTVSFDKSISLFQRANNSIPGGVNSPVRAFKSVGGDPIFMKSAKGAYLTDVDGNTYIDLMNSWGPMILGHCHPEVVEALKQKATEAISFGAPTEAETMMAELIISMVPNVDMIRLVSSGTEACMSALRVARGYTGRNKFIKFEGCYHGHADPFLVKAGSGLATLNIQTVPGIPAGASADTLTAPYNDLMSVERLFSDNKGEIAAIIIEPVAGNMGCVLPRPGFLEGLRKICTLHGSLLIFDEVMTGFRLAAGGAQERLGIDADLVTYGKVIGGGMPVGAFGGKKDIMSRVAPLGNVYQAGTLSGNPLAVTAGYTTLSVLKNNPSIYKELDRKGEQLKRGLQDVLHAKGMEFYEINQIGSMISLHFNSRNVMDFASAALADTGMFNRFFHHMLRQGIYLPPSPFESWFLSAAITDDDIEKILEATREF